MIEPTIHLNYFEDEAFPRAVDDLESLLAGRSLELEGDLAGNLCELFVDGVFDPAKLVRIHSHPTAGSASDITISLQPSDILLDLLAALRAGNLDGMLV